MITTDTHVYFYSGREIYSNWHRTKGQFTDSATGLVFDSSEQHFMWQKARFFNDEKNAAKIAKTVDAATVKFIGRHIERYDDKAWECVRLGCMNYSGYLKYSQNPDFGATLKATGSRILVEASPVDRIWGIGRSVEEAAAGVTWDGRNLLGISLMAVRDLLTIGA